MNFQNYFDEYERKARIYPAVIFLLPVILEVFLLFPNLIRVEGIVGGVIIYTSLSAFFASIIRNKGKDKQFKLWKELGAKPTTNLLRHNDKFISKDTKARYHEKINELIPGLSLPGEQEEKSDQDLADEKYNSAIDFLLEYTRDSNKYPLVFKENISYGFARNLWGIKTEAIIIILLLVLTNVIIYLFFPILVNQSVSHLILTLIYLMLLVFWVFYVNKPFVIMAGNNYGIALLRILDIKQIK